MRFDQTARKTCSAIGLVLLTPWLLAFRIQDCSTCDTHPTLIAAEAGGKTYGQEVFQDLTTALLQLDYEKHRLKKNRIDELVFQDLLEREARATGMKVDELLKKNVRDLSAVSEVDVDAYIARTFGEVSFWRRWFLRSRAAPAARAEKTGLLGQNYFARLLEKYRVNIDYRFFPPDFGELPLHLGRSEPFVGSKFDQAIPMIVFSDYRCGYCKQAVEALLELARTENELVCVAFRQFGEDPLTVDCDIANQLAFESGVFWDFQRRMFATGKELSHPKILSIAAECQIPRYRIEGALLSPARRKESIARTEAGTSLGVRSAPSVVVGSLVIRGASTLAQYRQVLAEALRNKAILGGLRRPGHIEKIVSHQGVGQ